jgi:hypothetical protein
VESLRRQLEEASQSKELEVVEAEKVRKNLEGEVQNLKLQLELAKVVQAAESKTKAQHQNLVVELTEKLNDAKKGKEVSLERSHHQNEYTQQLASNAVNIPAYTLPNAVSAVPTLPENMPDKNNQTLPNFNPQDYVFFQRCTIEELLKSFRKSKKKVDETSMENILYPFVNEVASFQKTVLNENMEQMKNSLKIRKTEYTAFLDELREISKAKNNRSEVDAIVEDFEDKIFQKDTMPTVTNIHPSSFKQIGTCSDDGESSEDERSEKQKLKDSRTEEHRQNRLRNLHHKLNNQASWRQDRRGSDYRGGNSRSYNRY